MRKTIDEFRGRHRGLDVWIVGGGASAGLIAPDFFRGKLTVGINSVHRRFRTSYLIRKDARLPTDEPTMAGIPLVMSEFDCSNWAKPRNNVAGAYYFQHVDNAYGHELDLSVIGTEKLVVAYSTLASALHFACELGARNVICCGCDGGRLDGKFYFDGYDVEPDPATYNLFLWEHLNQIRQVRDALQAHYGCRICSLSPFLGLTTDGREFASGETPPRCKHCGAKRTVFRCRAHDARFYECPDCGCLSSSLTYDDVRHVYQTAEYRAHLKADYEHLLREVTNNVEMIVSAGAPEQSVLDVGCFDGALLCRLHRLGWDVVGWDVCPFAPQVVEAQTEIPVDRILLGEEFRPLGRQFGAVVSRETIEHVPDHRAHLAALVASVMPGGILHLQTPRPHVDYRPGPTYNFGHMVILSPESVEKMLIDFGLTIEQKQLWETGQAWVARKPR